ncbi:hypothetical protein [Rhodopirellula baltica]|uniref:Uncharacterized protein n=1 Tax=Rhodopirellula baltica WH47 TaxID=991778 RepID=F2AZU7_RHOBT|nr:hypothetical protein [Rhodopirellula baltica]EGF24825.1 hypothetical protein RBWH47_02032 [Rhodopirellula baltica WH47]
MQSHAVGMTTTVVSTSVRWTNRQVSTLGTTIIRHGTELVNITATFVTPIRMSVQPMLTIRYVMSDAIVNRIPVMVTTPDVMVGRVAVL